jgi:uncharacterized protein (TIGR00299 family) protein
MTKVLYLDCPSGISGDMFLGSLIHCGLKIDHLTSELRKAKIGGYRLKARKVNRGGIVGVKFDVIYDKGPSREHTEEKTFKGIVKLINNSGLSRAVKCRAIEVFTNLADAESAAHGVPRDKVHFHEVGDIDSIVDILGAAIAIEKLGIEEVYSSVVAVANPAPATAYLLKGMKAAFSGIRHELVTPTGAAILKTFSRGFGDAPPMKILKAGYGAGSADIQGHPNLLRAMIGERTDAFETDTVTILETNIDDMNPQSYEYLMEKALQAGALDIYLTGVIMKKSRPGCLVTVVTEPSKADAIAAVIFEETSTFGVRRYQATRQKLHRKIIEVATKYGNIDVKLGYLADKLKIVAPEYESCKKIAKERKVPLRKVWREAENAAWKSID